MSDWGAGGDPKLQPKPGSNIKEAGLKSDGRREGRCGCRCLVLVGATAFIPGTVELPTLEDRKVQEVKVSPAVLKAVVHHYGTQCDKPRRSSCCVAGKRRQQSCLLQQSLEKGKLVNKCTGKTSLCSILLYKFWTCISYYGLQLFCCCQKQHANFYTSVCWTGCNLTWEIHPGSPKWKHMTFTRQSLSLKIKTRAQLGSRRRLEACPTRSCLFFCTM